MPVKDEFSTAPLRIMHIDLNSCFATVEQQARPLLRGKPVGIANRGTDKTGLVTASYEAKRLGVSVGMRVDEAKRLAPDLVVVESDPAKYRFVYHQLLAIMNDYSAHVTMKSIDEGVIDFHQAPRAIVERGLEAIGREIKQRLYDEIGCAMTCNVGISTNRFLAKTAANLHKPNGLDLLSAENLEAVFSQLTLTDLTGIARANRTRLESVGIYTPMDFLRADELTLRKVVFKSIVGTQWYQRLRGYEVDDTTSDVKRVGRQYVLERFDLSMREIVQRLHHLCESVGGRLRRQHKQARGVYVYARTSTRGYWHASQLQPTPFFSDQAIYATAAHLFRDVPDGIREIGVHVYQLSDDAESGQLSLFMDEIAHERAVAGVIDTVNQRYGDRTMVSADTINTGIYVKQKIPFGSTRYL